MKSSSFGVFDGLFSAILEDAFLEQESSRKRISEFTEKELQAALDAKQNARKDKEVTERLLAEKTKGLISPTYKINTMSIYPAQSPLGKNMSIVEAQGTDGTSVKMSIWFK